MTSDAKIGLLLGLVFIFIIAFVINGLPRFRRAVSNNELTTRMVDPDTDSLAIGERERRVRETLDWQEQFAAEPAPAYQPVAQNRSDTGNPGFEQSYYNQFEPTEELGPVTEVAFDNETFENIRYTFPLTSNASIKENTTMETPAYLPEPSVSARRPEQPPVKQPDPVRRPQMKTYIVQDGDRLSDIAKKFYGEKEGNRLVNINRIFEANRKFLKSADDIFIGQKLVIPPLPASTSTQAGTGIVSNPMFEQVPSVGGRTEPGQWYVVKEDDSLWKIAAEQLGNGSRYTEISKLNANILKDADKVDPGMRLRLPAR